MRKTIGTIAVALCMSFAGAAGAFDRHLYLPETIGLDRGADGIVRGELAKFWLAGIAAKTLGVTGMEPDWPHCQDTDLILNLKTRAVDDTVTEAMQRALSGNGDNLPRDVMFYALASEVPADDKQWCRVLIADLTQYGFYDGAGDDMLNEMRKDREKLEKRLGEVGLKPGNP
ncbi:hypothetical protein [Rhizobium sp. BG4]|uniref:hypothetical protein n=1 Tax=Rhizobium sp. BG4 TaxID=2613770 RepID=UPI00193E2848|nr:hypothetical protein [Rhizobium sp. BG4]QRM45342.1 hypothetical protein F2982_18990 [Rhizobium sp. BG4]